MAQTLQTEAYCAKSKGANLELVKIQLNPLRETEVEVQMEYCGLCHTDIHMKNNDWGVADYPLVPGHEGIGIVRAVGAHVSGLAVGDRIGIGWIRDSCNTCQSCAEGHENYCAKGYQGTYLSSSAGCWGKKDCRQLGCFAKFMHIEERFAFKIPSNLKPEQAAPLMCAGVTVWEPICQYVRPGTLVGIIALGGLGHMAVKLIRAIGGTVCVLSSSDNKRERAIHDLGAKYYVNYNKPEELKGIAGQLDVIIDTCPVISQSVTTFMNCLRLGGTYVRVGIPESGQQSFTYDYIPLIFTGKSIAGSIVCGVKNTRTMLTVAADRNLASDVEVMPFSQVNEAMDKLSKGKNEQFRIVLKW